MSHFGRKITAGGQEGAAPKAKASGGPNDELIGRLVGHDGSARVASPYTNEPTDRLEQKLPITVE